MEELVVFVWHLENVTGPVNIKAVHGEIEADLSNNLKSPVSLTSGSVVEEPLG